MAGAVVGITCAILILLFAGQHYGTSKVGFTFAPIVFVWFAANVMINLYNIIMYYPGGEPLKAEQYCPASCRLITRMNVPDAMKARDSTAYHVHVVVQFICRARVAMSISMH